MHVVALLNKTPVLNINIMRVKMSSDSTLNFYENYLNQFFQICCLILKDKIGLLILHLPMNLYL